MSSRRPRSRDRLRRAGIRPASRRYEADAPPPRRLVDPSLELVREARERVKELLPEDWISIWGEALCRAVERLVAERDKLADGRMEGLEEVQAACLSFRAVMDTLDRWAKDTGWGPGGLDLPPTRYQRRKTEEMVAAIRQTVGDFADLIAPRKARVGRGKGESLSRLRDLSEDVGRKGSLGLDFPGNTAPVAEDLKGMVPSEDDEDVPEDGEVN